jgi:hypothetical protein
MINIDGYCPMGCGQTLRAEQDRAVNRIICWGSKCPDPMAAQKVLQNSETEHIVRFSFGSDGFTIRHPLRERLDDALLYCKLTDFCSGLPGPPDGVPGSYRATPEADVWAFERMEQI